MDIDDPRTPHNQAVNNLMRSRCGDAGLLSILASPGGVFPRENVISRGASLERSKYMRYRTVKWSSEVDRNDSP